MLPVEFLGVPCVGCNTCKSNVQVFCTWHVQEDSTCGFRHPCRVGGQEFRVNIGLIMLGTRKCMAIGTFGNFKLCRLGR